MSRTTPVSRTTPRIALVTYRAEPGMSVDPDLSGLVRAVDEAGAEARAVRWDDPDVDWAGFDLVLIRSTWDYSWRPEEFLHWAARCAAVTRLANPEPVVRWNTDKRYLGELAAAGVPVVETRYLPPGDGAPALPEGREYVIKPASGAGARLAARYRPDERAAALTHVARMHEKGLTAMVQPYVRAIDTTGERALLFFGGHFLHAIRKGAVLDPGTPYDAKKTPHPDARPWQPTEAELAVAARALAAVPVGAPLLYGRVDLVDGDDGTPQVMELELVEPNLFLGLHPESFSVVARRLVAAARDGRGQ